MNEELIEIVQKLIRSIQQLAPEARVQEIDEIFEDEHANLEVYPPLYWTVNQCRSLQRKIMDRVVDNHLKTGYLVLVYVCTPEQQITDARRELVRARKDLRAAEHVLEEAKALGLANGQPQQTDPVPA